MFAGKWLLQRTSYDHTWREYNSFLINFYILSERLKCKFQLHDLDYLLFMYLFSEDKSLLPRNSQINIILIEMNHIVFEMAFQETKL